MGEGKQKGREERSSAGILLPVQSRLLRNTVALQALSFTHTHRPHRMILGTLSHLLPKSNSSLSIYFAFWFRQVLKNSSEETVFALIQSLYSWGRKHSKMTFRTRVILHTVNNINKLSTWFKRLQEKDKLPYLTSYAGGSNRNRERHTSQSLYPFCC